MNWFSLEKRVEIVKIRYKNGQNFAETVVRSSDLTVVDLIHRFKHLG